MKKSKFRGSSAVNPNNLMNITLKDGRRIFTTHNNFRHFVEDTKGTITPVTEVYFKNCLRLPRNE
jgi:hypothetical protein